MNFSFIRWKIVFYKDNNGREPVKDFILSQSPGAIGEILHVFDLLHTFGLRLNEPYVKHVKSKVWELRVRHSSDNFRFFYFAFSGNTFIMLHAIKKKKDKLLTKDIRLAEQRMNNHLTGS